MTSPDWGRVPGEGSSKPIRWSCPDGHLTKWAIRKPECPECGKLMESTPNDPYAERRRKIREERDKE